MALFPKRIEIDDASIAALALLFTVAVADLYKYLFTLNGRTISRSQILAVRAQTSQRLQTLGNDTGKWIADNVPYQYAQGQAAAAKQQDHFGNTAAALLITAGIGILSLRKSAANTEPTVRVPNMQFFELHNQSVQAIMDDMSASFGTSLTTIARSADKVISGVQSLNLRRLIAEQAKNETSVNAISQQITDLLTNSDIAGLVDKAGRKWQPDVYARMLARTKLAEAQNNGIMNALVSAGEDLTQVSAHGAQDSCGPWEGEILSISGKGNLYKSVADARGSGTHIFGPNCQHVLQAVNSALLPVAT